MRVDTSFASGRQGYQLTEIHHLGDHIVRVDIRSDAYQEQSWARVEILSQAKTWTLLATEPASTWHNQAPSPYQTAVDDQGHRFCQRLAGQLLDRARQILTIA